MVELWTDEGVIHTIGLRHTGVCSLPLLSLGMGELAGPGFPLSIWLDRLPFLRSGEEGPESGRQQRWSIVTSFV